MRSNTASSGQNPEGALHRSDHDRAQTAAGGVLERNAAIPSPSCAAAESTAPAPVLAPS